VPLAPGAGDSKLAAAAAAAIQHGAAIALGNPPPGARGFGGSLRKDNPSFETFPTEEALQKHLEVAGLIRVDGFWDDLLDFFGDIFEGIENAVISIAHFVVDVARAVVNFTLTIAEWTAKALDLPIAGIEKAASFMNGVFNSVDADIDKVVDWLKALFDFKAIWRTKMAIQQGVEAFFPYLIRVASQSQKVADGWFGKQKTAVNDAFDAAEKEYAGHTFGQLKNWQDPCAPPSSNPVVGRASPSDFTDNPHHNWLHDKVTSYPPDTSSLKLAGSIDDLWKTVAGHLEDSGKDFRAALDKFHEAVWATVSDPSSFATTVIPDLIDMVRELTLAALDLMDAIVDSFAALIGTGADLLDSLFKAELPLGFLNTLWKWIAEGVGHSEDDKLTMYSLSALLAALPCTLIYKLVVGVDHEPFPDGKMPTPLPGPVSVQLGVKMPWECLFTSDILRMIQVIATGAGDVLASDTPAWLTGINVGWSGAVWVLRHGYPDEEILMALALSGVVLGRYVPDAIAKWRGLEKDVSNDIVAAICTVYGVGSLAYGIYRDTHNDQYKQTQDRMVANILTPLPSVFSWLTLSWIRLNEELALFAIFGNLLFDFVGYTGGGLALAVETLQSKPRTVPV